ncbi:hypothetical protein [Streptomyces sp. NRRL S-1022]|uniref:SbtR family transcriptional regulator n=1 Tax=Streptomyces sp. NRRL S-1022 TaxID=1463880 RepID=UPI002D21E5A4|nr:hypothetical protein [Streptomyces sp. NRRL S-1022]
MTSGRKACRDRPGVVPVEAAQRDGTVRTDIDPAVTTSLIGRTALAVARAQPSSPELVDAYLCVLLRGLRPSP